MPSQAAYVTLLWTMHFLSITPWSRGLWKRTVPHLWHIPRERNI